MTIIRYADIYKTILIDNEIIEVLSVKDATFPIVIEQSRVSGIQPYIGSNGKVFKNVSLINYDGDIIKVVGNYRTLDNNINNFNHNRVIIKGFKNNGSK